MRDDCIEAQEKVICVEQVRVNLANEPRLVHDMLVRVFDRAPDFQPVAEVIDTTNLASAVGSIDDQLITRD